MCDVCGSNLPAVNSVAITSDAGPVTVYICTEFANKLNEAKKARAKGILRDLVTSKEIPTWPAEKAPEKSPEEKGWKKSKR